MHILLTDILRCPRCGPEFGLILLTDRIEDRTVIAGTLGCPNCRQSYPIAAGVADLRYAEAPPLETHPPQFFGEDAAFRLAALMGAQSANTNLLLLGASGDMATRIARIFPEAHVVAGSVSARPDGAAEESWGWPAIAPDGSGRRDFQPETRPDVGSQRPDESLGPTGIVSRTLHSDRLPFATGSFAAVGIMGPPSHAVLPELARVLRAGARLVIEGATADDESALRRLGFDIDLSQASTVVAAVRSPR